MKNLLIILAAVLTFASCKKVIDIDLNSSNPKFVIEGNLSNDTFQNEIKISKTINFSDPNNFPAVTNATVIITDNLGNTETLSQSIPGTYKISTLVGTPGRTYTMNVNVDGQIFTSTSIMPYITPLDSIEILTFSFGSNDSKNLVPIYKDSAGVKNYYRFVPYKNGLRTEDLFISNDQFDDGLVANQPLFGETEYKIGDTVKMDLQCIDKDMYLYYFSLQQNTSGGATPANPESNIKGGALGYFNAHSVTNKQIVIQ
jgi:hypothetical protein